MHRNRIVILGDSLGMPRPEVTYEYTYPCLLKNLLPQFDIISLCRRANDSSLQSSAENIHNDILIYKPDAVIIHLGIVDCTPRLFTRRQRAIISALGPLGAVIRRLMTKYRYWITKTFNKVYVSPDEFEKNIEKLLIACKDVHARTLIIGLVKGIGEFIEKSYNLEKNIADYNMILKDISSRYSIKFVDVHSIEEVLVLNDGHHLNKHGHEIIAEKLEKVLRSLL